MHADNNTPKPASFAAVIYHVYAKLHMPSGMSGILYYSCFIRI